MKSVQSPVLLILHRKRVTYILMHGYTCEAGLDTCQNAPTVTVVHGLPVLVLDCHAW